MKLIKRKKIDKPENLYNLHIENNNNYISNSIVVSNCHSSKAYELRKLLSKAVKARYRLGFTGTLHAGKLDNLNTQAYLGPIIAEYSSGELADDCYISKCNVEAINIEYTSEFEGTYNEIKDSVFCNNYRLNIIRRIVEKADHNILLLVGKVEKEGEYLENWLKNKTDKEVVFLSGRDDTERREKWRKACMKRHNIALIATYGIFSQGVNIPNLKYVILASPFKSKIRILQSIGRALRKHKNKKAGAVIYDIIDQTKYLAKHGNTRYRYYTSEGFNVIDKTLKEH